jgi:Icc-related predicted phosphoesterase
MDRNVSNEYCGSKALLRAVRKRYNIGLHVFGHIHERGGQARYDQTNRVRANVSVTDEAYDVKHKPFVIRKQRTIQWIGDETRSW